MEYVSTQVETDGGDIRKLCANDQSLVGGELAVVPIVVQHLQDFLHVCLRKRNQTGA